MDNVPEFFRGFYWSTRAYYAKALGYEKSVTFGMYSKSNGTSGEMTMKWVELLGKVITPKLEVFDDSWKVLYSFTDLLEKMAEVDDENISEESFVEMLLSCGFKDLTKYTDPIK